MKNVMKSLLAAAIAATPAFAGQGTSGANSVLITAFFGFAALIIAFQFVPAVVLFGAILKGLFSSGKESSAKAPKK